MVTRQKTADSGTSKHVADALKQQKGLSKTFKALSHILRQADTVASIINGTMALSGSFSQAVSNVHTNRVMFSTGAPTVLVTHVKMVHRWQER